MSNNIISVGTGTKEHGAYLIQYDLEQQKIITNFVAHQDDINSICYLNAESPVILTASDDTSIHLYDPRQQMKPVAIFLGHFGGLTHIAPKGDAIYFCSNSKDQSLKVWDIRKTSPNTHNKYILNYDYRYQKLTGIQDLRSTIKSKKDYTDCSVHTFTSHKVYRTLIRCRFSPAYQTNNRYVYSGSADGKIYIYDLFENSLAAVLKNRQKALIRDCVWHPINPIIIETNFQGEIKSWKYSSKLQHLQ